MSDVDVDVTQIMIPYCCLTGSAVFLRGSFFESAAIGGGGVRLNCTGSERGLLNCSHSNNICPSSELAGVACPGVFAAWRGCEDDGGWVYHSLNSNDVIYLLFSYKINFWVFKLSCTGILEYYLSHRAQDDFVWCVGTFLTLF